MAAIEVGQLFASFDELDFTIKQYCEKNFYSTMDARCTDIGRCIQASSQAVRAEHTQFVT